MEVRYRRKSIKLQKGNFSIPSKTNFQIRLETSPKCLKESSFVRNINIGKKDAKEQQMIIKAEIIKKGLKLKRDLICLGKSLIKLTRKTAEICKYSEKMELVRMI